MSDLEQLRNVCMKYTKIPNDNSLSAVLSKYVYKKCINHTNKNTQYLVILEKLDDTITNENREYVANTFYATFRADKLKVVAIIDTNEFSNTKSCILSSFRINYKCVVTIYEVGEIVYPDYFDPDINNLYSNGIHYFKTIEPAYYYNRYFQENYTGLHRCWTDNGSLICEGQYLNGLRSETWTHYYSDGKKLSEGSYLESEESGKWFSWYNNGITESVGEYLEGKKHGKWVYRYSNSKVSSRGYYVNDDETGLWVFWYDNGKKSCEGLYLEGKPVGMWRHWYDNGKKEKAGEYIKGERVGVWTFWDRSGNRTIANYNLKNKNLK